LLLGLIGFFVIAVSYRDVPTFGGFGLDFVLAWIGVGIGAFGANSISLPASAPPYPPPPGSPCCIWSRCSSSGQTSAPGASCALVCDRVSVAARWRMRGQGSRKNHHSMQCALRRQCRSALSTASMSWTRNRRVQFASDAEGDGGNP